MLYFLIILRSRFGAQAQPPPPPSCQLGFEPQAFGSASTALSLILQYYNKFNVSLILNNNKTSLTGTIYLVGIWSVTNAMIDV